MAPPPFRNARLSKAQRYIAEHIANPELGGNDLAAALCMSRRSLYMLLKEHDRTPARMIHDIRLERSMRVLADASQQRLKITDVGQTEKRVRLIQDFRLRIIMVTT